MPSQKIDTTSKTNEVCIIQDYNFKTTMASVENFKSSVIRIRNILRSPGVGITGMDSMRHICLYILSRYMTRAKVASQGVPEKFAWETLIETAQTMNGGVQKALDYFYHPDEDCLVRHFDRLFGTEKFSFDIKNLQKHKEILEILNNVNMTDVDVQIDKLGWVYEQHLSTGTSSASRDLGQYFTDRFICQYMTELCKPGFKSPGVPESVCDPTMGTGGFLTTFIKYYKKYHAETPIDWTVQQKEIHGCDTDSKVAGVARLNLYMEMDGNRSSNLLTHDSLYGDLTLTGFDIILANMPFGLKGITHAECCERVKKLKIRGTKSEPLFLQLMMVSLNLGGRCAVVVPDGMLVNISECHNETRKYLLDNFEVKRVMKMRGVFFMNTSIEPTILYFENNGKPTTAVEFWDVVRNEKGEITETMITSVPRAKIDATYSLDMRRYMEDDKLVVNPAMFPMVRLGDVCELLSGKTNNERGEGDIPFYDSNGQIAVVNKYLFDGDYIITARVLSIGSLHFVSGKFWAGDNTINMRVKPESNTRIRYLFYYLKLNTYKFHNIKSGIIPKIRKSDLAEIKMPLPPLAIQEEIVATLDRIFQPGTTELADMLKMTDKAMDLVLANPNGTTLEPIVEAQRLIRKSVQKVADVKAQMVADVKAQMVAIMKSVGARGFPMVKLKDNVSFKNGYAFKTKEFISSGIPIIKITTIKNGIIRLNKAVYAKENKKLDSYLVKKGDFVIALSGTLGTIGMNNTGIDCYLNQRVARIDVKNKELCSKYVYYHMIYSGFVDSVVSLAGGSAQPNVSTKNIENLTMPLPPIAFQLSLVIRLDALQSQLTALENLQKQSEDNARFILDSYLCTANESINVEENEDDLVDEALTPTNTIVHL